LSRGYHDPQESHFHASKKVKKSFTRSYLPLSRRELEPLFRVSHDPSGIAFSARQNAEEWLT
jgi:hypothetical protein